MSAGTQPTSAARHVKRVTFVTQGMGPGGAERVMATMANHWAERGRPVCLLTLEGDETPSYYPLHRNIELRPLGIAGASGGAGRAIVNNARRLPALRRAIAVTDPDVVIAFLDEVNILTLLSQSGRGVPVIVEEHTDPAAKRLPAPWPLLREVAYRRAARVVVLSEQARAYFPSAIRARTTVMPNPIVVERVDGPSARCGDRRTLVSLGRLAPDKGFDALLTAFAAIAGRHPGWDLTIWGDGPERDRLEALRTTLGVEDRAFLPGATRTPHLALRSADCFAMSSRREGFPMALGEAMACGLPVLSTDCPSGPRQLIRHGLDGLLVPDRDPAALAAGLDRLLADDELRARLAASAPEVLERFGVDRVMAGWEALIDDVTPARPGRLRTFGCPRPRLASDRAR